MNSKAVAALVVAALTIGVVAGLTLAAGGENDTTSGPGPTNVVAGVPVGYERSREGAVAAAAGYAGAVGTIALASPDARLDALRTMTAPDAFKDVRQGMEQGFDALAEGLREGNAEASVIRAAPIAYRIDAYTNDRARIELWAVAVVGTATTPPPTASWGITTVPLRWLDGDWKLAGLLEQSEGPTPQQENAPSPAEDLVESIQGFRSFNHVPAE